MIVSVKTELPKPVEPVVTGAVLELNGQELNDLLVLAQAGILYFQNHKHNCIGGSILPNEAEAIKANICRVRGFTPIGWTFHIGGLIATLRDLAAQVSPKGGQ